MTALLGVPIVLAIWSDWPWLWVLLVLQWTVTTGHWPRSPGPFLWELVLVLGAEGFLAYALPPRQMVRSRRRLTLETSALIDISILFGPILGVAAWQGTVGFDAGMRLHSFIKGFIRRAVLRTVRIAIGIVVLAVFAHGGGP